VLEIELTADERAALEKSAQAVREPMSVLLLTWMLMSNFVCQPSMEIY